MKKRKTNKKTPKRVLLDQYHVDIWIRPNKSLSIDERRVIKTLLVNYFELLARRVEKELFNKVQIKLSQ